MSKQDSLAGLLLEVINEDMQFLPIEMLTDIKDLLEGNSDITNQDLKKLIKYYISDNSHIIFKKKR